MALSREQITLEDAIDIRELKNLKLANQLLKVKRKEKEAKDLQRQQAIQQMQTESNIQTSQAAAQSKMQQIQMEAQAKAQIKQSEIAMEIEKMKQEAALKLQLMQKEFEFNMQLKGIDTQLIMDKDKMKEDAKDKRVSIQNTQQSKLIEQRQKGLPPINFESTEDSLDQFDLAQFEPK